MGQPMSFSYVIEDDQRLVIVRFRGDITYEHLTAGTEAAMKGRRSELPYGLLCDFSAVETWRLSASEMRALAEFHLAWRPGADIDRNALVAPQDHIFGCLRMWEAMTERMPFPRRVFRSEPEARSWLRSGELPDHDDVCLPH